ncbi:DegT/DnrJ/EryC1/StrS family aminotransferase [Candidatus Dojkabacteria bacterium]|nr:DegT/DnrJ/EryC1/StrS family aminotransferase [Candidatus Dojkabacteria bacterium]
MENLFIGTSPNIQKDDIWLIFKLLLQPWKWGRQEYVKDFESQMAEYLGGEVHSVAFDSARTSLFQLLKAWEIGGGDEVIVPSFTCVVVVNPILELGAKPVYIDTDPVTLNIDLEDLSSKVTKNTKAILVQHTFGIPVDVKRVREIVGPDVIIIEDLAHYLHPKAISVESDAAILTFGIEKMMTSMRGGMAVVKDGNEKIFEKLVAAQSEAKRFGRWRIFKWLLNPLIWAVATPTYFWGFGRMSFGRLLSKLGHKLGMMGNAMEVCEYRGCFPNWMPAKMPGALAILGMNQLGKLDVLNEHRSRIAGIYEGKLEKKNSNIKDYFPLRYPLLVKNPAEVKAVFRKKHVIIGNWYERILYTRPEYLKDLQLDLLDIPNTVKITKHIINLPTFIKVSKNDAREIADTVKPYLLDHLP